VYASRMGNGDEHSGDGYRYCGRGLIQLTGKSNYENFAASLEISPEEAAEYLATFEGAAQSACWFWESNNLNVEADAGDIKKMTKKINGGYIGLEDRIKHYEHALHIMGALMEKTKLTFVVTTMVTLTLCLVIICMVVTLMVGLFDTVVDNTEIFKLIGPAFQTVIGGFIGLLAGIKLKNEDEDSSKSDQMQLLHWQILSLEKKIEQQNKNKE